MASFESQQANMISQRTQLETELNSFHKDKQRFEKVKNEEELKIKQA